MPIDLRRIIPPGPLWFTIAVLALVALRFLHFGEYIDDPHSWRQCDTANYAWAFFTDGIDLLHPQVCWMGGHKVTILEFPLPEAIVALFYQIFGPSHVVARVIFLLFFLGAARYFFLSLRMLVAPDLARIATVVFLSLPLGIFYSRAVHVDFSAVFFAHAMFYYFLRGLSRSNAVDMVLGSLAACLGMLIKAPYVFYLALPLIAWIVYHGKWGFALRFFPAYLLPLLLFWAWRSHTGHVNAAAPDWEFIPDYHKFTDMWGWYFGKWELRSEGALWQILHGRYRFEVAGNLGYWIIFLGFLLNWKRLGHNLMRLWALGTALYMLIFFPLNLIHDYYQIPLLAPTAFFIAVPIWHLMRLESEIKKWRVPVLSLLFLAVVVGNNVRLTEKKWLNSAEEPFFKSYFQLSEPPIEAGKVIRKHTPDDALVIASYGSLDCRAPMVLYRSRRNGWSIPKEHLSASLVQGLQNEGATHLVLIRNPKPPEDLMEYLKDHPSEEHTFGSGKWKLRIFGLQR